MNQDSACFLRAIRGPVIMITVGVLFALDNFTPFTFNRTWPVLLVVVGILNLGRGGSRLRGKLRYQAQWGPPRPPFPPSTPTPPSPPGAPSWTSSAKPAASQPAGPGSYRGSAYETDPSQKKPGTPDVGARQ